MLGKHAVNAYRRPSSLSIDYPGDSARLITVELNRFAVVVPVPSSAFFPIVAVNRLR
jgi:hypothetical protein